MARQVSTDAGSAGNEFAAGEFRSSADDHLVGGAEETKIERAPGSLDATFGQGLLDRRIELPHQLLRRGIEVGDLESLEHSAVLGIATRRTLGIRARLEGRDNALGPAELSPQGLH